MLQTTQMLHEVGVNRKAAEVIWLNQLIVWILIKYYSQDNQAVND
jgi:hypothetical protein